MTTIELIFATLFMAWVIWMLFSISEEIAVLRQSVRDPKQSHIRDRELTNHRIEVVESRLRQLDRDMSSVAGRVEEAFNRMSRDQGAANARRFQVLFERIGKLEQRGDTIGSNPDQPKGGEPCTSESGQRCSS